MLDHVDYDLIRLEHVNRLLSDGEDVFGGNLLSDSIIWWLRFAVRSIEFATRRLEAITGLRRYGRSARKGETHAVDAQSHRKSGSYPCEDGGERRSRFGQLSALRWTLL